MTGPRSALASDEFTQTILLSYYIVIYFQVLILCRVTTLRGSEVKINFTKTSRRTVFEKPNFVVISISECGKLGDVRSGVQEWTTLDKNEADYLAELGKRNTGIQFQSGRERGASRFWDPLIWPGKDDNQEGTTRSIPRSFFVASILSPTKQGDCLI